MRKSGMLLIALLALSVAVLAQSSGSQSGMGQSSGQDQSSGNMGQSSGQSMGQGSGQGMGGTSVEGCLQGSNGSYTLTAKDGTTYQLSGDTSKLAEHVGHEVRVMGRTSSGGMGSSSGASSSSSMGAGSQQTLEVKGVKHVSKSCTTSSSGMSH